MLIHIQNIHVNIGWSLVQSLAPWCWHIRAKHFYRGNIVYLMNQKILSTTILIKCCMDQILMWVIWEHTFRRERNGTGPSTEGRLLDHNKLMCFKNVICKIHHGLKTLQENMGKYNNSYHKETSSFDELTLRQLFHKMLLKYANEVLSNGDMLVNLGKYRYK